MLRRWWEGVWGEGKHSDADQGAAEESRLIDAAKKHDEDMWRAVDLLKSYLPQVTGENPVLFVPRWDAPPIHIIRVGDLISHLKEPLLVEAISERPAEARKPAAIQALNGLREVMAARLIPGHCDHCPPKC